MVCRWALACLSGWLTAGTPVAAFELITAEEAAYPIATLPSVEIRGSPTRRPQIIVVSPPPGAGLVHSPLHLQLRFRAFGGAEIALESIVVTYLKKPLIDITQRIKPFIAPSGIDIADAEAPPGLHKFLVVLKDRNGLPGQAEFSFEVAK